ncbi:hypothetical protein [Pseudomonas phage PPpW-3]|uniref:Uncharacterized protein n=1 Tax=Pseudomonas phage PPpW-3 TaxID=1279082 RepID=V5YSW3_9CAUD|nr:hypothetical protein X916_gp55 [Pseudomonas phage PPpW-3]BAO20655.1 hypothetical protein [Pseudomonas phage PPpW-3]
MIPTAGNDFMELRLENARRSERGDFAETNLKQVEAILGFAMQCGMIDAVEYGNRITLLKLIRAQRENRKG